MHELNSSCCYFFLSTSFPRNPTWPPRWLPILGILCYVCDSSREINDNFARYRQNMRRHSKHTVGPLEAWHFRYGHNDILKHIFRLTHNCRADVTKTRLYQATKSRTDGREFGVGRPTLSGLMGLLQLRYEHDSSTIRVRFEHDSATTRYNTLRCFSCARIRDRIRESVVGVSCMLIDSSRHTAFTLYFM